MTGLKTGLILAGAVIVGVASAWLVLGTGSESPRSKGETYRLSVKKAADEKKAKPRRPNPKKVQQKRMVSIAKPDPPKFEIGDSEEAKLTAAQAKLLAEIRAALQAENKKEIIRLIRKLQAMDEWPDGIPKPIKLASLKALGWCGAVAIPELLGFLGDADNSIVSTAGSYWEDAIAECDHDVDRTLSDGTFEEGIATHVKNAAKVITDAEVMDSVLDEICSGMRHSVAVETIKEILSSGNDLAKQKVKTVIENLTDDETIQTAEQLDAWLKNNPDDPDDKFMYGGEDDDPIGDAD